MDLEELSTAVRPAEGEGDGPRIIRDGILLAGQPLEAAPAVDLEHAGVVGQHLAGAVPDPVLGVDVGHRRRQVALPGAVVPGDAPEIAGPGPALAGRQHRQAVSSQNSLGELSTLPSSSSHSGFSHHAVRPIQSDRVARSR
jgi:hypothetical protein